ncbi:MULTISPECIES: hypothetical protein [unclassified Oceanispirochaeta]|uniref:DUF6115 domain-containing protein n=1 Tax=unclassified Oceanispirochaeta TaxID=2635722 RepID=UPI000E08D4C6|nr:MULTISPECIES: hypothetical protein [unclassified Oceanispirochaeta]MBF9016177.1 hypothetical protein [Oceanispirochaeta sp. M2]NPD72639.1 hypothetical protein [Oceanispirochaeta sp. M1]RDG31789.1 hypothetical protein DV872_11065 [Oceanispirochaeta sp. M1]
MTTVFTGILLILMAGGFIYLKLKVDKVVSGEEWIRKIRDEIDQLILEMNQTAERNVALLENRVKVLQDLLDEADKKLQIMQKETEKSDLSRQVYSHLKKQTVLTPPKESENDTPGLFDDIKLDSAPTTGSSDTEKSEKEEDSRPLKERVMDLYEQGFGAELISQRLGASISEVDLIINLRTGGSV